MPELPEVQTVVNDLNDAGIVGCAITKAAVYWPRIITDLTPKGFAKRIEGQRIGRVWRRAKYIVIDLEGGGVHGKPDTLFIHLRMSGRLDLKPATSQKLPHEHVILTLDDDRQLRYHDTRKFGRWCLTNAHDDVLNKLGPEPLEKTFTAKKLHARITGRRRAIKPLLLDQAVIAGLGNIYVDEALWEAGLHPERRADSLKGGEVAALNKAIKTVLRRGLNNMGTTLGTGEANFYSVANRRGRNRDRLRVFRRDGEPCPRCKETIVRIVLAQRSTHLCPQCQS